MLLKIKEVKHLFYNFLSEELLREESFEDDATVTEKIPHDVEKTHISKDNARHVNYVQFMDAQAHASEVPLERKSWILKNLDGINPLPGGDLTDQERIFYVLTKADIITKDLVRKLKIRKKQEAERREKENLAHIERIKNRNASSGEIEGTGVIAGNSGYRPDYDDTISIPILGDDDTI